MALRKDWCWSWNSSTLATWCEEQAHWKRPWCWERWKAGGEGDNREWDGWMASPIWWTWVWANSRSWWWTGKPGVLQSMGSQRVRHNWVNWTELKDLYSPITSLISSPTLFCSLCSSYYMLAKNIPVPRPLRFLFPLPRMLFPTNTLRAHSLLQSSTQMPPSQWHLFWPSSLNCNLTYSLYHFLSFYTSP